MPVQMLPSKGISIDPSRDRLTEMLLQWIAAPASGTEHHLVVATIAELGAQLLNAIMSLYGVRIAYPAYHGPPELCSLYVSTRSGHLSWRPSTIHKATDVMAD